LTEVQVEPVKIQICKFRSNEFQLDRNCVPVNDQVAGFDCRHCRENRGRKVVENKEFSSMAQMHLAQIICAFHEKSEADCGMD
jgi:hypothetical protein